MKTPSASVQLKRKFINETLQLYKNMTRGYQPDIKFLYKENTLLSLIEDYPELEDSLKYNIDYFLVNKW